MKTLDEVKARCEIEDWGKGVEHWIWGGASFEGVPRIHAPNFTIDPSGGTLNTQTGPRAVWHIKHGKPLPAGRFVWMACRVPGCVNHACLAAGNGKARGKATARSGILKGSPRRIAASRVNASRQRKVTRAVADEILGSDESNLALAARLSLHKDTISRVRRGLAVVPGNLFQGLMR